MQADSWQKEGDVTAAGVMLEGWRNIGAEPDPEKECILVVPHGQSLPSVCGRMDIVALGETFSCENELL